MVSIVSRDLAAGRSGELDGLGQPWWGAASWPGRPSRHPRSFPPDSGGGSSGPRRADAPGDARRARPAPIGWSGWSRCPGRGRWQGRPGRPATPAPGRHRSRRRWHVGSQSIFSCPCRYRQRRTECGVGSAPASALAAVALEQSRSSAPREADQCDIRPRRRRLHRPGAP